MGFFDKILKAIGFESVEEESTKKPKKESVTSSKFNLKNKSTKKTTEEDEEIEMYSPKNQAELENVISVFENGESALVNFANFSEYDKNDAIIFLSGAVFALKYKMKKIQGNLYLISKTDGELV